MDSASTAIGNTSTESLLAALTATRLLGRWSLVCQRHGSGCSCCPAGLGDIDMAEVERLLAKDLRSRHTLMHDREGFAELLKQCVARNFPADGQDLPALLEDIGRAINELERIQSGFY